MQRPDHPLRDTTAVSFHEGLSLVTTDLTSFFIIVEKVGRDEAVLLLLIRALKVRDGLVGTRIHDLAARMRWGTFRLIRSLDRLVDRSVVVYSIRRGEGHDRVVVEEVSLLRIWDQRHVKRDLPTHWFENLLPLIGPTTFAVFLYFVWCEGDRPETHVDHLVTMARLGSAAHAHRHLGRLRRAKMLVPDELGTGVIVRDPPPLSRRQRLLLRFRAIPFLHDSRVQIASLLVVLTVVVVVIASLARHPLPLLP